MGGRKKDKNGVQNNLTTHDRRIFGYLLFRSFKILCHTRTLAHSLAHAHTHTHRRRVTRRLRPRLKGEHSDNVCAGISNEINGAVGLCCWGWDYSWLTDSNKHNSRKTVNEQKPKLL